MANLKALTVEDLMAKTGWSKGEIYKKTSAGKLPYYRPFGKTIFFNEEEVDQVLLSNRQKTDSEIEAEASDIVHLKKAAI